MKNKFYLVLRSVPIFNTFLALIVIRFVADSENNELKLFILFFPLLFEIFKMGYQMLYWSSGESYYDNYLIDGFTLLGSFILFCVWFVTDNIYTYILALSLSAALLGKIADLYRQCEKKNVLVTVDSALPLIVICTIFNSYTLILCYAITAITFLIFRFLPPFHDSSIPSLTFHPIRRLTFLVTSNTGLISQLLFFSVFSGEVGIAFIFIMRFLTGSSSLSAYYIRFFPKNNFEERHNIVGNFVSASGVIVAAIYLFIFDYQILMDHFLLFILFSIYQIFRYTITRNAHLIVKEENKILVLRFLLAQGIIIGGFVIFHYTELNFIYQILLPIAYFSTAILDALIVRKR